MTDKELLLSAVVHIADNIQKSQKVSKEVALNIAVQIQKNEILMDGFKEIGEMIKEIDFSIGKLDSTLGNQL
jgi:hypothetical protein